MEKGQRDLHKVSVPSIAFYFTLQSVSQNNNRLLSIFLSFIAALCRSCCNDDVLIFMTITPRWSHNTAAAEEARKKYILDRIIKLLVHGRPTNVFPFKFLQLLLPCSSVLSFSRSLTFVLRLCEVLQKVEEA